MHSRYVYITKQETEIYIYICYIYIYIYIYETMLRAGGICCPAAARMLAGRHPGRNPKIQAESIWQAETAYIWQVYIYIYRKVYIIQIQNPASSTQRVPYIYIHMAGSIVYIYPYMQRTVYNLFSERMTQNHGYRTIEQVNPEPKQDPAGREPISVAYI